MQASNPQGQGQGGMQKPTLSWQPPNAGGQKREEKPAAPKLPEKNVFNKTLPPPAGGKSGAGLYTGIFIGGLIVGLLVGWGVGSSRTGSGAPASSSTSTSYTAQETGAANATSGTSMEVPAGSMEGGLIISTQAAGLRVSVSSVSVSAPTWVVIYEDHNGVPGNALGAGLFYPVSQGGTTSGTVELLRGTTAGQHYLAGESLDDGDHIFSLQNDKPLRDAQGNPLLVQFSTQ